MPPATAIDIAERNEDTPNVSDYPCRVETSPTPRVPDTCVEQIIGQKVPLMLKRLLPFNSDGLSEGMISPENGGRVKRRQLKNSGVESFILK